ncbi:MAG: hypothetical protein CME68_08295 [Halobacteriovoraceae bacterium]|nr:hypothetical protein [Halobacteriovoraceae bacterium]|tara:strand:+ start:420 stop:1154 length:735 start_codon:yes stop_codon:yes gene_type:complete
MKIPILFAFLIFLIQKNSFSLEVDKKLMFSIINFSKTKRTLLINRGLENGLKKGDQAKFFLDSKRLVARAALIKASPTRSLWSVFKYRNKKMVKKGRVLNLIITKKVSLTNDITKKIFKSNVFSGKEDKIPVSKKLKSKRTFSSRFLTQKPKGDFSAINDMQRPKRKKPIDYSNLKEIGKMSRFNIKTNYDNLKESDLERGFGKKQFKINKKSESKYSNLMEFSTIPPLNEKKIHKIYSKLEEI